MGRRSSAAEILSRSPPPPPTISPLVVPSLDDLSRAPVAEPKPRKPPRRITWLALGLLFGVTAGIVAHDWVCAKFPRTHGWLLEKGHAIHEYFAPSAPGVVVAVGAPSAAARPSPSASATSSGGAPASAPSGAPSTMRIDDLPKAKH